MAAPRKHAPQGAAEVIKSMASQGYSIVGIAAHFKVVRSTVKRWFEEDESLEEAFEQGRETERQALHALIVQSAVQNKPANANAMFLLKCRHSYREFDSPNTKVDVNLNQPQPVLVVRTYGSDEEWEKAAALSQRKLIEGNAHDPLQHTKAVIAGSQGVLPAAVEAEAIPQAPWLPREAPEPVTVASDAIQAPPYVAPLPTWDAPASWRPRA